jgi:acetyl/propionyl-CoA carboxylase alpha subunit
MQHEAFTSGKFDTHFVKNYFQPENLIEEKVDEAFIAAIIAAQLMQQKPQQGNFASAVKPESAWKKNRTQF